jgi:hypothetical protein
MHQVCAQDFSDDILMVSVGESYDRYSGVAEHLEALLQGTDEFSTSQVDIIEESSIESLADGYYDPNTEDESLRSSVAEGYRNVILIPTIITTPTGTIEFSEYNGGPTEVYDDLPYDNEYFTPEVFYEGCTQFSKLILDAGSTPLIFLPDNPDEAVEDFGPVMYRVANGVGMDLVPGAYALESAGAVTADEEAYLYACSIFSQLTGQNASVADYIPSGLTESEATILEDLAKQTVDIHYATEHYTGSYEESGAVVYRSLDVSQEPFNNVIRYRYKGSSTHNWTSSALALLVAGDDSTTSAVRKLGTKSNGISSGTRYWHPDDFDTWANTAETLTQGDKLAFEPDQAAFMYVSGSWQGAYAQDVIDCSQSNMVPLVFDWIKSFAIGGETGTSATTDALDYHSCNELYFNYAERGWKLIPLTIGMGRINEATTDFSASEDGLHCSDLLVFMNAYMMLSSSLGMQFPLLTEISDDDFNRGSYTLDEVNQACLIGYDIIKELAFLSETQAYVPDSSLRVVTESLPDLEWNVPYSQQLSAVGGDGSYSWEVISTDGLPAGLSLSSDGLLAGTVTDVYGTWNLALKVSDGSGAFRKFGLKLELGLPEGNVAMSTGILAEASLDYGTDVPAVLYSDELTAPDGLATFKIAITVDPMANASVSSLASGTWGIKSGEAAEAWDTTLDGSLGESVDLISNIEIVNFNANGGSLTVDAISGLSFQSVDVHSANHGRDRVLVTVDSVSQTYTGATLATDPATIDLQELSETDTVSSFSVACGSANSANRWNVGSIQVGYTLRMPSDDAYINWAADYGLSGEDAQSSADVENGGGGDGYSNLIEFALGMDPTVADASSICSHYTEVEDDDSRYFVFKYLRRSDYLEQGLSYTLFQSPDLSLSSSEAPDDLTVGEAVGDYEPVTARYLIDEAAKFIWLQVEAE